ncbi:MAG: hypothetical protein JF621_28240 [Streptomyces turgidiscabies]|nr:hypothetical protein [Streptomyces turgidiscabies]
MTTAVSTAARVKLPAALTSFVGRRQEMSEIRRLLSAGTVASPAGPPSVRIPGPPSRTR